MSIVRFKGNKNGIQLMLASDAEFDELLFDVRAKLLASKDFFSGGAGVTVSWGENKFNNKQTDVLKKLLSEYGLVWDKDLVVESPQVNVEKLEPRKTPVLTPKKVEMDGYEAPALVINKNLRSGTRIIYDGIVVLFGDMNPGSEIVAGRDIVIYGTCRGLVHAGAFGARDARIVANKLKPIQIRIADVIARAPDGGEWPEQGSNGEVAYIDNNTLVVKPMGK
ncbi:MAG: septum site-determining protein MinC [Negativicutes bacterium]|jgi:septum site-determining protein MinC